MEAQKSGISLENKLLTSSKLQGSSLLLHSKFAPPLSKSNNGRRMVSRAAQSLRNDDKLRGLDVAPILSLKDAGGFKSLSGRQKPTVNSLLTSDVSRELTRNHLLQRPTMLLASGLSKDEGNRLKSGINADQLGMDRQDIGTSRHLHSSLLLSSNKSKLNLATELKTSGDLKRSDNPLLKTGNLSAMPKNKGHESSLPKWKFEKETKELDIGADTPAIDMQSMEGLVQSRPIYELEVFEDAFSKELAVRANEANDFKEKLQRNKDPEVEKQIKFVRQRKVFHGKCFFLLVKLWNSFSVSKIEVMPQITGSLS